MGSVIDQKIVQMRFDNGQFERGVNQSMSSINNLKAALSFGNEQKQLSSLVSSTNKIAKAFSPLGRIATGVFGAIGAKIHEAGLAAVNTFNQMSMLGNVDVGFEKYSEMTKAVQTIMAATRKDWDDREEQMAYVSASLKDLNWFTDETSYDLKDMTSNIGKFTSAGIKLDDAKVAMMGIATWAGLSGANVQEASRAMYNLSQAMAMGGVYLRDWMSIENANMATIEFKQLAIDTAVALGKLKKVEEGVWQTSTGTEVTLENFRTTLNNDSGNWFNNEVLTETLSVFGEYPNLMHDAVDATGMSTNDLVKYVGLYKDTMKDLTKVVDETGIPLTKFQGLIRDYNKSDGFDVDMAIKLKRYAEEYGLEVTELTAYLDQFKDGIWGISEISEATGVDVVTLQKQMDKLASSEYDLGYEAFKASQESRTLADSINYTKDAVTSAWMRIYEAIFGEYLDAKDLWTNVANEFYEIFVKALDDLSVLIGEWGEAGGREKLLEGISNIYHGIKDAIEEIKGGFGDIIPAKTADDLMEITDRFLEFTEIFKMTEEDAGKWHDVGVILAETLIEIKDIINDVWELAKDAWKEIFPNNELKPAQSLADIIKKIVTAIKEFVDELKITDSKADKLKRTFKGVFAVLDILRQLISAVLKAVMGFNSETEDTGDGILDITSRIGDWIVELDKFLKENNTFETVMANVVNFLRSIPGKLDELSKTLFDMDFPTLLKTILQYITDVGKEIKLFFDSFNNGDTDGMSSFFQGLKSLIDKLKEGFALLQPYLDSFLKWITNSKDGEFPSAQEFGDALVKGGVLSVFVAFVALLINLIVHMDDARKHVKKLVGSISGAFNSIGDAAKALKTNIQAQTFKTIATSILMIAASMVALSLIPTDKLLLVAPILGTLLLEIAWMLNSLSQASADNKKLASISKSMGWVAFILAEFVGGILAIANFSDIASAIAAANMIGALFAGVIVLFKVLDEVKIRKDKARNIAQIFQYISILIGSIGTSILLASVLGNPGAIATAGAQIVLILSTVFGFALLLDKVKISESKAKYLRSFMQDMTILIAGVGVAILIAGATGNAGAIYTAGAAIIGVITAVAGFAMLLDKMDIKKTKTDNLRTFLQDMTILIASIGVAILLASVTTDPLAIYQSGLAIAGVISSVMGFALMLDKIKIDKKKAEAMSAVIASISVMMAAIGTSVALMSLTGDWKTIGTAGIVLAGMMFAVSGALRIFPDTKNMSDIAVAITAIGTALILMGGAIALATSSGDWALIVTAGGVLAGMILAIAFALRLMGDTGDIIKSAAALAVVATGVLLLGIALSVIDGIGDNIGIVLLGLAGALLAVIVAGFAAKFVAVGLLALGAAIAFIGIGALAAGAGLWLFAQGISTLANISPENMQNLLTNVQAFFAMLPELMTNLGEGILAFIQLMIDNKDVLVQGFTTFIVGICEAIDGSLPKILETLGIVIVSIIDLLITLIPKVFELADTIFMGVVDLFWKHTPEIVAAAIYLTQAIFDATVQLLYEQGPVLGDLLIFLTKIALDVMVQNTLDISQAAIDVLLGILNMILENIGPVTAIATAIAIEIVLGLIDGVAMELDDIIDTGINFILALLDGLGKGIDDHAEEFRTTMENLAKRLLHAFCVILGIDPEKGGGSKEFEGTGKDIVGGVISGIRAKAEALWTEMKNLGSKIINGFKEGVSKVSDTCTQAIGGVVDSVVFAAKRGLREKSPSKVFEQIGEYVDLGFADGITGFSDVVTTATSLLGDDVIGDFTSTIGNITDLFNFSDLSDPTITPVLDLSTFTEGIGEMNDMLPTDSTVSMAGYAGGGVNYSSARKAEESSRVDKLADTMVAMSSSREGVVTNNTFNISGDDPKAIANEVSRILNSQVERRNAAWV